MINQCTVDSHYYDTIGYKESINISRVLLYMLDISI